MINVTKGSGNVFLDVGFSPAEAENLKLKSTLVGALRMIVQQNDLNNNEAARLFYVTPSAIENLNAGRIDAMRESFLLNMLFSACSHVKPLEPAKKRRKAA